MASAEYQPDKLSRTSSSGHAVSEEDHLRARFYRLLAELLSAPLDASALSRLATLAGDETEMGQALSNLSAIASRTSPEEAEREYNALFIGMTEGELIPFGSFYLTGFLFEKPLAALRDDMTEIGIEREENVSEPEDHIASLSEMMAGLIVGDFGADEEDGTVDLYKQKNFFDSHVGSWADRFFEDLEKADSANLYRPVGTIGRIFMSIERQGFSMLEGA